MKLDENIVAAITAACPDAEAVWRFGSWGTPWERPDSDLDVAVLMPHDAARKVRFMEWARLNGEIARVSGVERVDLVNLRTAPTDLQAEILRCGNVLFCRNEEARIGFEAQILALHQDLNLRREALYQDIMADCRAAGP